MTGINNIEGQYWYQPRSQVDPSSMNVQYRINLRTINHLKINLQTQKSEVSLNRGRLQAVYSCPSLTNKGLGNLT